MDDNEDLSRQGIIIKNLGSASNEKIIKDFWPSLEVKEKLGAGSFGAVYRVENTRSRLKLTSAVKLIRFPQDNQETHSSAEVLGLDTLEKLRSYYSPTLNKVMDEIRLMEELKTSGTVVTIQDFACIESRDPFCWVILIRMELLTSLADYRKKHELTVEEVIQVGKDMCRALEICHKRNIIHRDVKESNIFRSEHGTYKLGDFGISRHMEGKAQELSHKGTGSYMAPEILRGDNYDFRVDIYALGISLYRLLNNNRLPFLPAQGPLTMETVETANACRLSGQTLPNPQRGDQELADILRKACAYKAEDRFASPADFGEALDFYLLRKKEKATGDEAKQVAAEEDDRTFAVESWQSQQMAALGVKAEQPPSAESSAAPFVNPYAPTPPAAPAGQSSAGSAGPVSWPVPGDSANPAISPSPASRSQVNPYATQAVQTSASSSAGQAAGPPSTSSSFNREIGVNTKAGSNTVQSQKARSKNKLLLVMLILLVLIAVLFLAIYFSSNADEGKGGSRKRSTEPQKFLQEEDADEEALSDKAATRGRDDKKLSGKASRRSRDDEEAFEEEEAGAKGRTQERATGKDMSQRANVFRAFVNLDAALEALDYDTGTDLSAVYREGEYTYMLKGFRKGDIFEGAILVRSEEAEHLSGYGKGTFAIRLRDEDSEDSSSKYDLSFLEGIHCWIEAGQNSLLLRAASGTISLYLDQYEDDDADYSKMDYTVYECVSDNPGDVWYQYHYVGKRYAEPTYDVGGAPDFWLDPRELAEP